jgi:predicted nucleic acid-binding protein
VSDIWIPDSAPLIILAKIGRLDLLTEQAEQILIPWPVFREIMAGPESDPARRALLDGFGSRTRVDYIPSAVRQFRALHTGEQSVLAAALKRPGALAILDDAQARSAADRLGIRKIGTLGIVRRARLQGILKSVTPVIAEAIGAGLHVPNSLARGIAESVGETWADL